MGERPRSEWSSPSIVLTIVLALLTAQQTYSNFNNSTASEIRVLAERIEALQRDLRDGRAHGAAVEERLRRVEARR